MNESDESNLTRLKIGLLGGSFDPPHKGHLFISKDALARFNLDYVWWIIAKQNSLKTRKASDFDNRVKLCKKLLGKESKILVLDIEKQIKSEDTINVINFIKREYDNHYFWLMGFDSFFSFDKWPKWQEILHLVKIIVYDRPSFLFKDNKEKISLALKKYQKIFTEFQHSKFPAWTLVKTNTPNISSTEIRQGNTTKRKFK